LDLSTDSAWEEWGKRDPYFAVITHPRYRRAALDKRALEDFFASGQGHADYLMSTIRKHIDPAFAPSRVVEFGCGVGRLLIPFASIAAEVVGLDVSDAMLQEARRNCDLQSLHNVRLIKSDYQLSELTGSFDLLHSCIVFQHIPCARGQSIIARLLQFVRPGGVAALHVLYSHASPTSVPETELPERYQTDRPPPAPAPDVDPEMQMNPYDINRVLLTMQRAGVQDLHIDFTDHGGELGLFLFCRLPEN